MKKERSHRATAERQRRHYGGHASGRRAECTWYIYPLKTRTSAVFPILEWRQQRDCERRSTTGLRNWSCTATQSEPSEPSEPSPPVNTDVASSQLHHVQKKITSVYLGWRSEKRKEGDKGEGREKGHSEHQLTYEAGKAKERC